MKFFFSRVIGVVALLLVVQVCVAKEWKMPLANDSQHFLSELSLAFAAEVKAATAGRVSIRTYPAGSLFKGEQIFGAVRNNLVPIGSRLMSALDRESLMLQLDALPFLAKSYLDAFNLYKVSKLEVEKILKVKGVKFLYAIPWPAQGLYSRIEITALSDLNGLKFRPYSEVTAEFGERLGLVPVVIARENLLKSLRRKQLDIMFGSALVANKYPIRRYFGYWYDIKAWRPKEMVVVNLKEWEKLAKSDREAVSRAARRVESLGWIKSKQVAERSKQFLVNKGVIVGDLPVAVQRAIERKGLLIVRQWLAKIGDPGRYLLERYIKL